MSGESVKTTENIYKPRDLRGSVMLFGWILLLPFFVEQLVEMIIDNERLSIISIAIPQEIITIFQNSILLCFVLGVLILATCGVLGFVHKRDKIPFKDDVVNDLHDLLVNQNFIDKDSPNWESQIKLQVKKLDKNVFEIRFRIKDPKGTAEYFRKLNLSEGGTFENCIDCRKSIKMARLLSSS
jgi:hypothetical protein